jgi:hypothetical protein
MLYFLVAFILLTTIKQWNSPLFSPQATINPSEDSYPLEYSLHQHLQVYSSIATCTRYDNSFPCLELIPGNLKFAIAYKNHNVGCMTHNAAGCLTHNNNTGRATHNNVGHATHNNTSHATHKCYKKCYKLKHMVLCLILAINRSIYYLTNGNFNCSYDVNHLINRLLLMLQQYITRFNDFKHCWIILLLSGLLKSQCVSLQFLILCSFMICWHNNSIMAQKISQLQTIICRYAFIIIKIMPGPSSFLHFICSWSYIIFIPFYYPSLVSDPVNIKSTSGFIGGGGRSAQTDYKFLKPYIISTEVELKNPEEFSYVYSSHCTIDNAIQEIQTSGEAFLACNIPIALIAHILTATQANKVAKEHNIHALSHKPLSVKQIAIKSHVCTISCNRYVSVFKPVKKNQKSIQHVHKPQKAKLKEIKKIGKVQVRKSSDSWRKPARMVTNHKYYIQEKNKFPPSPPSKHLMHKIISGFCKDTHPSKFEEAGCAVCGQLVAITKLTKLKDIKCSFDPLVRIGVTRLQRNSAVDPIKEIEGPIIDANCKHVCHECIGFLEKKVMPPMALANGLWVGNVPKELSDLTFVERLLVSRIRSNCCIVHVLKGGWKMQANAIMFPSPVPKLCNILPPPIEELDEVIAFMFTGVVQPTAEDMKRTPMLARQKYISAALE